MVRLIISACRYVARKIRAAAGGEEQLEKLSTAGCKQAKSRKGDRMSSEPALMTPPTEQDVDVLPKENWGS